MSTQFEIATQLARLFGQTTSPIRDVSANISTPESRERNRLKRVKRRESKRKKADKENRRKNKESMTLDDMAYVHYLELAKISSYKNLQEIRTIFGIDPNLDLLSVAISRKMTPAEILYRFFSAKNSSMTVLEFNNFLILHYLLEESIYLQRHVINL